MINVLPLLLVFTMKFSFHPFVEKQSNTTISENLTASIDAAPRLFTIHGKVAENKVVLEWEVGENETADQFEVEKSFDGASFKTAALVFGTDQPAIGNYKMFEKATAKKVYYRVKLLTKSNKTEYSDIIEIDPAAHSK